MLVIKTNGTDGEPIMITLASGPRGENTIRVFIPDGKSILSGDQIASIMLNKEDSASLKRNL